MSDSQEQWWSDDPNAPKITHVLYFREKATFAGSLIGSILYGMRGLPVAYLHVRLSRSLGLFDLF